MHMRRCHHVRQKPTAEWTATPTVLLVCKYSLSLSGCLVTPCLQVVCLLLTCCCTSTEAKRLIRDGGRGGGGGTKERRLDSRNRPKKTRETVDRRQNNRSVKAMSPCHCTATSALRNCCFNCRAGAVTRTMSVALLLRNNLKRKKSNFCSPAPPPCS